MQKIISLIAALVVFSFSFIGEDVNASICSDETSISQSVPHCDAPVTATAAIEKNLPAKSSEHSAHDCHFGHCSFTLIIHSIVTSPSDLLEMTIERLYQSLQSGYRSETLRPPSLA